MLACSKFCPRFKNKYQLLGGMVDAQAAWFVDLVP